MSDLGEIAGAVGGEVLGLVIGVPMAIICVLALPVMGIQKGCQYLEAKKHKVEQAKAVYDVVQNPKEAVKHPIKTVMSFKFEPNEEAPKKETLSFRAGQKVKESGKDFVRGLFTKSN